MKPNYQGVVALLSLFTLNVFAWEARADVAVIVNKANDQHIDRKLLTRVYLGKQQSYNNGVPIKPFNSVRGGSSRATFNLHILGRSSSQVNAFWSKQLFTGKGVPPKELSSDSEIIARVSTDKSAIGYVNADAINDQVKVIDRISVE